MPKPIIKRKSLAEYASEAAAYGAHKANARSMQNKRNIQGNGAPGINQQVGQLNAAVAQLTVRVNALEAIHDTGSPGGGPPGGGPP